MMNMTNTEHRGNIHSQDNLTLCRANYFETCWCKLNTTELITCPYLLRHISSISNSSHFCIYHTIRQTIDCFNSSFVFPKTDSISSIYIYLTICIFIIGLIGNGLSIIILFNKTLRYLSVYRNLTILCTLNIFYLLAILIRHRNNYNRDLRDISPKLCRLHTFVVAFTGHLCSWQLVSTSIQRVHALLSLQAHRRTSWIRILSILFICMILPLFLFDGQLLFNYGLFSKRHMCDERSTFESKQFQRALHFPMDNSKFSKNISIRYHAIFFQTRIIKPNKCGVCILWNIFDTFLYAIIPFLIILISSIIIIIKICERRRSTIIFGGICHTNRRVIASQDNLSTLLIIINCLFLIMTGPFNISLIIQSIMKYFFSQKSFSMKIFLQLNQYLRLLQNAYHAFSFIFYCVIGNKFRNSAWSICRRIYYSCFQLIFGYQSTESSIISCSVQRKIIIHNKPTISSSTNDPIPRMSINLIKRKTCITVISTEKRTKILKSAV